MDFSSVRLEISKNQSRLGNEKLRRDRGNSANNTKGRKEDEENRNKAEDSNKNTKKCKRKWL